MRITGSLSVSETLRAGWQREGKPFSHVASWAESVLYPRDTELIQNHKSQYGKYLQNIYDENAALYSVVKQSINNT